MAKWSLWHNLSLVGSPIIFFKPIWWYLGFYFDHKLNFQYHTHFYAMKYLFILNTMKILQEVFFPFKNVSYIGHVYCQSYSMGSSYSSSKVLPSLKMLLNLRKYNEE